MSNQCQSLVRSNQYNFHGEFLFSLFSKYFTCMCRVSCTEVSRDPVNISQFTWRAPLNMCNKYFTCMCRVSCAEVSQDLADYCYQYCKCALIRIVLSYTNLLRLSLSCLVCAHQLLSGFYMWWTELWCFENVVGTREVIELEGKREGAGHWMWHWWQCFLHG